MADNNVQDQDAVEDDEQVEQQEGETPDSDEDQHEPEADEGDADGEVVITIGEEAPPHDEDEVEGKPAPAWVKNLRIADREKAREIRELKQQLAAKATTQEQAPTLGAKPTLESVDYDEDRYEAALDAWKDQKRSIDDQAAKKQKEVDDQQKEWEGKVNKYKAAKATLKVANFDDAEAVVTDKLSLIQQSVLMDAIDTPELQAQLVYALSRNEGELKRIASITNPVKFAVAVSKLESQLKVTSRKAPPAPEKVVRGSAAAIGVNDPKLARLEAAAEKSGDRTEVARYKKQLKIRANA